MDVTSPRPWTCALAALAALTLTACGTADELDAGASAIPTTKASSTPDPTGTLRPGDPVPKPRGKVVLTIRGGTVTNVGRTLQLDLSQLDAIGTTELRVDDLDATGRRATFSGPLVRDVLALAGASRRTMHTVALNDYAVDVPVEDAQDLPLVLATRMDGERMSVANYGPTRFIYPTSDYKLNKTVYGPRWIWQLRDITVT